MYVRIIMLCMLLFVIVAAKLDGGSWLLSGVWNNLGKDGENLPDISQPHPCKEGANIDNISTCTYAIVFSQAYNVQIHISLSCNPISLSKDNRNSQKAWD